GEPPAAKQQCQPFSAAKTIPSPAVREKAIPQPFSCVAGEGGAQRRMRARAKRAALALPRQHQKHASLRSRPLIRPPGTFSREREKGFLPIFRRKGSGPSPSPAKREKVA